MNTIRNDALREYAAQLCTAGFTVYVPKSPGWHYIGYSRVVDGQECLGFVQRGEFASDGWKHHMPIKPSLENGSSMWIDGVPDSQTLTVDDACRVASPVNRNPLVGVQRNYIDAEWMRRGHVRLEPTGGGE